MNLFKNILFVANVFIFIIRVLNKTGREKLYLIKCEMDKRQNVRQHFLGNNF